jgi:hypothetical protein
MKTGLPVALAIAGALTLSCLVVEQAHAVTVYTYTGNTFSLIQNETPPDGTYTTSMSVTGSFTLQNPLPANSLVTDITANVLSFSLSDGRSTITDLNATFATFQIGTALGNINSWFVNAIFAPIYTAVGDQNVAITTRNQAPFIIDIASTIECTQFSTACDLNGLDEAIIQDNAGTWSVSTSETPLPAALPLFATGLGALGLLGWRRKRKAVGN